MGVATGQSELFKGQTTNASSSTIGWLGGKGAFMAWGTFGGGTCKLEFSPDGGVSTWLPVDGSGTNVTLTAPGGGLFELPPCKLRATLSGSTGANLNANVSGVRN